MSSTVADNGHKEISCSQETDVLALTSLAARRRLLVALICNYLQSAVIIKVKLSKAIPVTGSIGL
jgi:hypothetical protein